MPPESVAWQRADEGRKIAICGRDGEVQTVYCAGKFALTGWSEALATELRRDGIEVSAVIPPLLRDGAPVHVHFNGRAESEFGWFTATLTSRGFATSTERAARMIVRAVRYGDAHSTVSAACWMLTYGSGTTCSHDRALLHPLMATDDHAWGHASRA